MRSILHSKRCAELHRLPLARAQLTAFSNVRAHISSQLERLGDPAAAIGVGIVEKGIAALLLLDSTPVGQPLAGGGGVRRGKATNFTLEQHVQLKAQLELSQHFERFDF